MLLYGKFEIPPGTTRTINIIIKADKEDFSAQFTGLYWPGDNKDNYQSISLTHPFKVTAPSKDPLKDTYVPTSIYTPARTTQIDDSETHISLYGEKLMFSSMKIFY